MKFTKLSLAAMIAMGVASSAFAVENVKVDGQIKLWYQTADISSVAGDSTNPAPGSSAAQANNDGLFKQDGASGNLIAKLRATGDLTKKVGFGTVLYAASTMGLENNLVANEAIAVGSTNNGGLGVTNGDSNWPVWLGEAYFTYKAGNTIAKIGRQELDTPLAFTETWNAAPNTFEAAVLLNKDLKDTTLVGAFVSRGNGSLGTTVTTAFNSYGSARTVGENDSGAYALGAVTTLIPMTTAQAWYYNVTDIANAYWLETDSKLPYGIGLGLQYGAMAATGTLDTALKNANVQDKDTDAYAIKLYGEYAGVKMAASYSSVSEGVLPLANTATGFTKTKLYTASILSDGRLAAQPDVKSWKLEASTKLAGFDLGASYASYDVGENNSGAGRLTGLGAYTLTQYQLHKDKSPSEFDFSVGTKIDEVNLTAYYIMQSDYTATAAR